MPRAVAAFHERHPDVELSMIEAEPYDCGGRLTSGEIDLALVYDDEAIPGMLPANLELTRLIDDRYDAILPKDHRLAGRRALELADLAAEPWAASTLTDGCRQISERACSEAGFEMRVAFETDETLAQLALVAAGVGVTLLPQLALTAVHPSVLACPLSNAPVRRVWAARVAGAYHSPAGQAMLQILREVSEEFVLERRLAAA